MKFGSATTSLPITTPLILKWQRRWLLTVHYGTGRQRMLHVARAQTSTSVELEGHHIVNASIARGRRAIMVRLPTAGP